MNKDMRILLLVGIVLLLLYNQQPFTIICSEADIYTDFRTESLDFACSYNQWCKYQANCLLAGSYPYPSNEGTLNYGEEVTFYCGDGQGEPRGGQYLIELSVQGRSCTQTGAILTPFYQQDKEFTTNEDVVIDVKVDGKGEGYIVHGLITELNLQRSGYTSFGIASLDFDNLARGQYTIEIWGEDAARQTIPFEVKGVLDLTYSFQPIQPYNFIEGYIYLKDENNRGLSLSEVDNFDVKIHDKSNWNYFNIDCSYLGKDDILGGKWHCTGNTGNGPREAIIDITIKKNGYEDAIRHIDISTFIPSLVIEAYCQDLDCPFPNSATLDDTKSFKFYVKHDNVLVDASSYSVKVTSPSRMIVDQDITSSVLKSGIGTYIFSYGPFSEVEAYTFTIHATYPGADPQTIYPKVSVTKEEAPIVFNPWIIIIPIAIGGIILWLRRRK